MDLVPGKPVDVRFTKWGGGAHWEFPVTVAGSDEHGVWCLAAAGTECVRPGVRHCPPWSWVMLFPPGRPWVASFYDHPDQEIATYVDITTPPTWQDCAVTMVDLDLDVVQLRDGRVHLDDEDEFAAHQVTLAYPPELIALARRTADEVLTAVKAGAEPFGVVRASRLDRRVSPAR